MKDKMLGYIGLIIIALAMFMICVAGYWKFVPVKVVTPNVQPYKIMTPVVAPGDDVVYQVNACKYNEAQGTIYRYFIDEAGTSYPTTPSYGNVRIGCLKTNVPVLVPKLPSGTYHLLLDVGYQVNPLRVEYYHLTTDNFVITGENK